VGEERPGCWHDAVMAICNSGHHPMGNVWIPELEALTPETEHVFHE